MNNVLTLMLDFDILEPTKTFCSWFYDFKSSSNIRNFLYYTLNLANFAAISVKQNK